MAGIAALLATRMPKHICKQQRGADKGVQHPDLDDWVRASVAGNCTMITGLLVQVSGASDHPVLSSKTSNAGPTIQWPSSTSRTGAVARIGGGPDSVPPRIVKAPELKQRTNEKQMHEISSAMHLDHCSDSKDMAEDPALPKRVVRCVRTKSARGNFMSRAPVPVFTQPPWSPGASCLAM